MPSKSQELLKRRQQELARQAELAAGGYDSGFEGPTTTQGGTPEQSAAAALAKARFYSQQLENFQPPRPEQTGISKFARNPVGMALMDFLPTGASNRNREILSGETDRGQLENAFAQALQGSNIAQSQMGVAQAQRQLTEEERNRALDQIVSEELGKLKGLPQAEFAEKAPTALGEAGARTGKPALVESALGAISHGARARADLIKSGGEVEGRKYLGEVFKKMQEDPQQFEDPGTLQNTLTVHAFITGDTGQLQAAVDNLTGNKRYAEEHSLRTQELQRSLDRFDQQERESILKGTLEMSNALMPAGTDFNAALGLTLKAHGKTLDNIDPDFKSALQSLETPLVKMNKLREAIEAEKSLNGQWDRLNEEYGRVFDPKTGKPTGWLKSLAKSPALPMADGSKMTVQEFVLDNFQKRISALLGGGAAGVNDQTLEQLTPGLLAINEQVQKQLEEERQRRAESTKTKNEGAYRAIQEQATQKPTPSVSGGASLRQ